MPRSLAETDPATAPIASQKDSLTIWFAEDRRVVMYPCDNNERLNFVCIHPDIESQEPRTGPAYGENTHQDHVDSDPVLTTAQSFLRIHHPPTTKCHKQIRQTVRTHAPGPRGVRSGIRMHHSTAFCVSSKTLIHASKPSSPKQTRPPSRSGSSWIWKHCTLGSHKIWLSSVTRRILVYPVSHPSPTLSYTARPLTKHLFS
jgi:hypothetical protein